jgi:hypothetical protein
LLNKVFESQVWFAYLRQEPKCYVDDALIDLTA